MRVITVKDGVYTEFGKNWSVSVKIKTFISLEEAIDVIKNLFMHTCVVEIKIL